MALDEISKSTVPLIPYDTGLDPDDPASVFLLLQEGLAEGIAGALLTIVDISGGAPRALGSQMAVLADGRYCGYVSGGCVEAAVAAEAVRAIESGRDEILRFGTGSPFIDIKLPCGGSIDVHVHVGLSAELVHQAQARLAERQPFAIRLRPADGASELVPVSGVSERSSWQGENFVRQYHPLTRLVLIGEGHELVALSSIGRASGLPVAAFMSSQNGSEIVEGHGTPVTLVTGATLPDLPVDPFTAVVFLLHDRFKESRLLESALGYDPFYVGALGSQRTHAGRIAKLQSAGVEEARIARLHGPIGLFGPTRTASTLAISVLGEIAEARMRLDG